MYLSNFYHLIGVFTELILIRICAHDSLAMYYVILMTLYHANMLNLAIGHHYILYSHHGMHSTMSCNKES